MIVHFVCTGNSYRSRLAEAYFNSRRISGLVASSSGTLAQRNLNGPITWYAARIIQREKLVPSMSHDWTQTTSELLNGRGSRGLHGYGACRVLPAALCFRNRSRVWSVPDVDAFEIPEYATGIEREAHVIRITEETFVSITKLVDELIDELSGRDSDA